jgi:hypothetical protein
LTILESPCPEKIKENIRMFINNEKKLLSIKSFFHINIILLYLENQMKNSQMQKTLNHNIKQDNRLLNINSFNYNTELPKPDKNIVWPSYTPGW